MPKGRKNYTTPDVCIPINNQGETYPQNVIKMSGTDFNKVPLTLCMQRYMDPSS